ncbi:hypothetical protein M0802_004639 [Mischocyttarus mexicanus]|nr:hypothetical protein M0802_004639 [Mischocyttarus mexicanus]
MELKQTGSEVATRSEKAQCSDHPTLLCVLLLKEEVNQIRLNVKEHSAEVFGLRNVGRSSSYESRTEGAGMKKGKELVWFGSRGF